MDLHHIFCELARLADLDEPSTLRLKTLELAAETAAVLPRPGAPELLQHALVCGKTVVLASDMYLPAACIATMLAEHGITGWHKLYVSSEIGLRKDTGRLYDYILEDWGVQVGEVMVVGDNERSDLQIPGDRGMRTLHMLRPVELARGTVRLAPLIDEVQHGGSLDANIGLGLIVRKFFGRVFHDRFDPEAIIPAPDARAIGYAVAGPLVLAFTQWLLDRASQEGVERLHFLAREGQFLKLVYDRVALGMEHAPSSSYLVLSRRAVNVPAIKSIEDVLLIARTSFGPASLKDYLLERFGLELTQVEKDGLFEQGLWRKGKPVDIRDGDIDALRPLLDALLPAILRQAELERRGLVAYLNEQGVSGTSATTVVDIGYSGTIQHRLNALLGGGVNGYYMATFLNTESMEARFDVRAEGCFCHRAAQGEGAPLFIRRSFFAEKLLSSDDPQVIRYGVGEGGALVPEFRVLTREERETSGVRADVRAGALEFVEDVMTVREGLLPDFRFPPQLAMALFETFVDRLSSAEDAVLRGLVLDDHYCGRGLVA
ncbi:putative haloacid dehydrogenase (HAD) [Aromatoleum bremense]|uniref:hypothetical protein n=1 Tax=Aromatoleum bremense TaxID=76115 RepID=UPI001AEBFF54|nr:hypothetical protein [Aromatoleum bremense]QTQ32636.1 putative haloacid dehydrogenase (HAD) [Aromatoleum bremense]